ncbi:MAG TPA: chemotaxis protein CheA [Candidatus Aquicultor sp.]|jgi:two-component system chemotaxis sensor kinase CheA
MDLVFDASPEDLKVFVQEAEELIQQTDENILRLEKEGEDPELIQEIFRAAHTIKGSAGMLGHERMAQLMHAWETLFDKVRKGELSVTAELIDILLDCLDALKVLKDECYTLKSSGIDIAPLSSKLLSFAEGTVIQAKDDAPTEMTLDDEDIQAISLAEIGGSSAYRMVIKISENSPMPSVRLYQVVEELQPLGQIMKSNPSMEAIENAECGTDLELILITDEDQSRIESIVKSISELSSFTIDAFQDEAEAPKEQAKPAKSKTKGKKTSETDAAAETQSTATVADERILDRGPEARGKSQQETTQIKAAPIKTVRVDVERLDHLMNLVGELVIGKTRLLSIGSELADNYHLGDISGILNEVTAQIGQITNELQEEVMRARMLPIEQVFNKFPRLVRDLARNVGKEVNFVLEGQETEIDRSVLEEIGDPLIHLIRNAIDHGVETPEERKKAKKPSEGNVYLGARHEENHIVVEISDDGKGMDAQKLKEKAIKKGFITPEAAERMSDRDAYELIFLSGFSTADKVSEISGRGVGMDVVRNNIKKINASIEIDSELGKGTKFMIKLPLTLVIVDALTVVVEDKLYAIPLSMVKEVLHLEKDDIKMVERLETILLRGSVLPLLRLNELFGNSGCGRNCDDLHVVVVGYGDNKVGIVVDSLVSKMEIMIKALGDYLGGIDGISGATILGDGRVALVIDPVSLISKVDTQRTISTQTVDFGKKSKRKKIA